MFRKEDLSLQNLVLTSYTTTLNIKKLYAVPNRRISVIFMGLRTNSDYLPIQQWLTIFFTAEPEGSLSGTSWISTNKVSLVFVLRWLAAYDNRWHRVTFPCHITSKKVSTAINLVFLSASSRSLQLYIHLIHGKTSKSSDCNVMGLFTWEVRPWNTHEIHVSCKLSGPLLAHNWPRLSIKQTSDSFVR